MLQGNLGEVGRQRTKDFDLPKRTYRKNGAFWYVDAKNEWHRLAALDDYAGMLKGLGLLLTKGDPLNTIELLWARYQADVLPKLAKKTQTGRRNDMKRPLQVFGKMDPADVDPHHVWTFWRERGETEQARHEIRALSALLTFARQCGARKTENPCFALRLPGAKARDLYVTDAMFYAVHDIAPWQIRHAMEYAWCAGLDESTIIKLERRNCTPTGLLFGRSKTTKMQAIDGPDLVAINQSALREPPQVRRFIVCRRDGKQYTANGFQIAWQRALRKAIELGRLTADDRYHFHDVRGKAGSESASDEAAMNLLGHADKQVTIHHYRRLPQRGTAVKIFREKA